MPKRGIGFTVQEVDVLLSAIERFLPIGPYEWDRVLAEHESHFPEAGRTKESLKRKFTVLCKARHPTGDPDIPADVLRAKKAYEEITKKAEVSEGGGSDDEELEEDHIEEDQLPQGNQEGEGNEHVVVLNDNNPDVLADENRRHHPEIAEPPAVAQQRRPDIEGAPEIAQEHRPEVEIVPEVAQRQQVEEQRQLEVIFYVKFLLLCLCSFLQQILLTSCLSFFRHNMAGGVEEV
jgi:hypothetical protein